MAEKNMSNNWLWAGRYVAVILLSVILAAALGNMGLFEKTTLAGKLNAAHIVQFLGYGAALTIFWMLGLRATRTLQQQGGKALALLHLILPVVSLIVMALAYSVLLLLFKPFMGATLASIFNWTFIVLILACAGWLVMAVFNQSAPLTELLIGKKAKGE